MLREQGDKGAFLHQWLIRVVARLGDRARVEQEAVKTLAVTEGDAWDHPKTEAMVAEAFAIVGDADRAIPLLEHALAVPAIESITAAHLRLDPVWDPIRNDSRFQKLASTP
jgi:serine/threonine-protein kinase